MLFKKALKYTALTLLGLLLVIVLGVYAVFNSSYFQNWLCGKATTYLSAQFNTKISIGNIRYNPFSSFTVEDVYFGDQRGDTLFYAGAVSFNLGRIDIDSNYFELRNVQLDRGLCKVTFYRDGHFSMDVLLDFAAKQTATPGAIPFHMQMTDVHCTRTRFIMDNFNEPLVKSGFDPYHEVFYDIDLKAKDFHIIHDSLVLRIEHLGTTEKGGLRVNHIEADAIIANQGMYFDHLQVETPHSKLAGAYHMSYRSYPTLAEYIDSVTIHGQLTDARVDMRDLACFAPEELRDQTQQFRVSAEMQGTVADFKVKKLRVNFGNGSTLHGRVSITGLPDYRNTYIDARLTEAVSDARDISYLVGSSMPDMMTRLGKIKFSGDFTGFMYDFVAYGNITTALGSARSDLNMKLSDTMSASVYSGNLDLTRFDLGRFLDAGSYLGPATLHLAVDGKGFDLDNLDSKFSAEIESFEANRYNYRDITMEGSLKQKMFNGNMVIADTNLNLTFDGLIDLNKPIPVYQFRAEISRAFLQALHFDTANTVLAADVDMNFAIRDLDHNEGYVSVNNINCVKDGRDFHVDHVILQTTTSGQERQLNLQSDELDASIKGMINLRSFPDQLYRVAARLFPDYFNKPMPAELPDQRFTIQAKIKSTRVLGALFFPSIGVEQMELSGSVRALENQLDLHIQAGKLRYYDYAMNRMNSHLQVNGSNGKFTFKSDELVERDTVVLSKLEVVADATRNIAELGLFIRDSANHIFSDCKSKAWFRKDQIEWVFNNSRLEFRKYPFVLSEKSTITFGPKQIDFSNFSFTQGDQYLILNGFYDFDGRHNLRADLNNIDLSIINAIYRKSDVKYGGRSDGALTLKGNNGINYIDAYLEVKALKLDNDLIGDYSVTSNFNEKQKRFMVYAKSLNGKLRNLEIGGYIETSVRPFNVNLNIAYDESPLNSFQAFLKGQLYIFEGTTSARCKLSGRMNDLALTGKVMLNNVKSRIEYLKTTYTFSTALELEKDRLVVNQTNLVDEQGKAAQFSGMVKHQSFQDFDLDISLNNMNRFKVLNTTLSDNSLYYGTGYASGSMRIHGPIQDIVMDATLRTERGTQLYIPLQTATNAENQMMHFINTDTTIKTAKLTTQTKLYGFSMNLLVEVTPDAEVQIIMDPVNDDKIRGSGKGTLKMELTRQGLFNMYGGVTIEEGQYNFSALGVVSKRFVLQSGSTILWAGDPLGARLDINGVYKVRKTSVAELLPYVSETQYQQVKSQKVPVNCLMFIKGSLLAPEIRFDINFPDLNSNLGAENVGLDNTMTILRNNPDLMNQQVVSLMVFNTFLPMNNTNSATGNISSGVSNTLSDLVSKQVNKGVEKLVPGLDFNVDVQMRQQEKVRYILSASQKLLNDRLELQVSYDMSTYGSNVLTQYNIRKDGSLKLRAFNKTTNTTDPTTYKNITTQGIGLYYRKEFDHLSEVFKRRTSNN